jgi:hypothetical protein
MKLNTIEVVDKQFEGTNTVSLLEEALRDMGIGEARAFSTAMYTVAGELSGDELTKMPELVHHHVTQTASVNKPIERDDWDFAIRVDYKPGVTDNAARILKADMGGKKIDGEVFTSLIHYVKGNFDPKIKDMLERVTSNPKMIKADLRQRYIL